MYVEPVSTTRRSVALAPRGPLTVASAVTSPIRFRDDIGNPSIGVCRTCNFRRLCPFGVLQRFDELVGSSASMACRRNPGLEVGSTWPSSLRVAFLGKAGAMGRRNVQKTVVALPRQLFMIRRVARGLTARAVVRRRNRWVVGSTSRRRPWSVSTPIWLESPRRPKTMRRGARRPMISMSTSPIARGTDRPSARSRWTTPTDRTPRVLAREPGMHVYVKPVSTRRRSRTSRPFGPRNVASAYTSPIWVLRGIFPFHRPSCYRYFPPSSEVPS